MRTLDVFSLGQEGPGTKSRGARRHQGCTKDAPRRHQGGTKEAPRRSQGGAKEATGENIVQIYNTGRLLLENNAKLPHTVTSNLPTKISPSELNFKDFRDFGQAHVVSKLSIESHLNFNIIPIEIAMEFQYTFNRI